MSVDIHPGSQRNDTAAPAYPAKTGPGARIVAGSLAAGAVVALVLSLVFAGGTESVITVAVLIGFGFGWALIAGLTSRYTPVRSAGRVVPAASRAPPASR